MDRLEPIRAPLSGQQGAAGSQALAGAPQTHDRTAPGAPSADGIAACTAGGVHGYAQLLLHLLSVAQGSYARNLDVLP